jgi:hypothetical protein
MLSFNLRAFIVKELSRENGKKINTSVRCTGKIFTLVKNDIETKHE